MDEEEEVQLRKEVDRARERATLRHKNTGKWAKSMARKQGLGEDQRRAIEEMLDRGEKLKRNIQGQDSDSEQDDNEEDEEVDEYTIKARAFEELAKLGNNPSDTAASGNTRGVFEMKFMKDAMARDSAKADRERDDFIRELGGHAGLEDDSGDNDSTPAGDEDVTVERLGGRVVSKPGTIPIRTNSRVLGVVEFIVWDKDLMSKDYLGEVALTLEDWFVDRANVTDRPFAFDDPNNQPFSINLDSTRANTHATGYVEVKLGFVSPNPASPVDFNEVFSEMVKRSRPSLVSAPLVITFVS